MFILGDIFFKVKVPFNSLIESCLLLDALVSLFNLHVANDIVPRRFVLLDRIARTAYVCIDVVYCYQPSSMVCRSVCHASEPCKNG